MNTRNNLLSLGLTGIFLVFAFGSTESNKEAESKLDAANAIQIRAVDLAGAYANNEVAADSKYKNKTLRVSGTIDDIGKDIMDNMYITLAGREMLQGVQAYFTDAHAGQVAELRKGASVAVLCRCEGLMMHVQLNGCQIE